ncbi:MAG: hypothetical protein UT53_C0032G0008, partial [Candidatus Yanofskybacteria bacterium GW2011_GWD2_39_48]
SGNNDIFNLASSSGTSVLRVTKSGNVGIGTTGPGSRLEISTASGTNGISLYNSSLSSKGWILYPATNGSNTDMRFYEQGTSSGDRVTFQAGGNVGIGTTAPATQLDIWGTSGDYDMLNIASSSGTSIFRIAKGGNIGIGTTQPSAMFQVYAPPNSLSDNIPTLTSNSTPSPYVASASSTYTTYYAYTAFDKVINDYGWIANGIATGRLTLDLGSGNEKTITKYILTGTLTYTTRSPKTWAFQGSNNGTSWTTLDNQTNVSAWGSNEQREYTFSNTTPYRYYRCLSFCC